VSPPRTLSSDEMLAIARLRIPAVVNVVADHHELPLDAFVRAHQRSEEDAITTGPEDGSWPTLRVWAVHHPEELNRQSQAAARAFRRRSVTE
jgi:hypothetical protein